MDIMYLHAQSLSHVQSLSTPLTVAPLSWNPPGKNTGVGSHPFSRDLPDPGIELWSPALQADSLPLSHQGSIMEHTLYYTVILKWKQWQTLFSWAPKSLKKVAVTMKLKNKNKKTHLLVGRKAMTKLDCVLKSRDTILSAKVHMLRVMVFPVVNSHNKDVIVES